MGSLHLEGMLFFTTCFISFVNIYLTLFAFFFTTIRQPSLSKFYLDRVQQAHSFTDKNFHSLVTLHRFTAWRLGPEPNEEALAHELNMRRCELFILHFSCLFCLNSNTFFSL